MVRFVGRVNACCDVFVLLAAVQVRFRTVDPEWVLNLGSSRTVSGCLPPPGELRVVNPQAEADRHLWSETLRPIDRSEKLLCTFLGWPCFNAVEPLRVVVHHLLCSPAFFNLLDLVGRQAETGCHCLTRGAGAAAPVGKIYGR